MVFAKLRKRNALFSVLLVTLSICGIFLGSTLAVADNPADFLNANPQFQKRSQPIASIKEKLDNGGEGNLTSAWQEAYDNRAYPSTAIAYEQAVGASSAFQSLANQSGNKTKWQELGPVTPTVPALVTYTGHETTNSGRVTALAVSAKCGKPEDQERDIEDICRVWVGAAGGGVWRTDNGLADKPEWTSSSNGMNTNAIGSLSIDPTDRRGTTIYAGTGEPNGSGDSEAGTGLFKSTDGGKSWAIVPGSVAAAKDRSIGAVLVDPANSRHIYIGTAVARHGSSSSNGGRFTPPGAPQVGLYESTDGGATFSLVFSKPSDAVNPVSPTGGDYFRGGITKIEFDQKASNLYFSMFDYGLFRKPAGGPIEQVFSSAGRGIRANSSTFRTEFSLAPMGNKLRIYLGDLNPYYNEVLDETVFKADLYRVDDANVPAATLTNGVTNSGWKKLSSPDQTSPGYDSYNFCEGQCSYDMFVASPPGSPDKVWLGGQMQYGEIFTAHPPSNGRAVIRSENAGVNFTDMTNDTQTPYPFGMHPDQHAIVFSPGNPEIAFVGSDGGVVRTSGTYANRSSDCDNRGLSATNLANCKRWLSAIPTRIYSLNDGLRTLQFQSLSVNPKNPLNDIMGGTQDNGTWAYSSKNGKSSWFESVGGDGGNSGIDPVNPNIRTHTYYSAQLDINFRGTEPSGWNWISDPFFDNFGNTVEAASFYVPVAYDPNVGGTIFTGLQHVWRTKDSGGSQAPLEQHCNEYTGDFTITCGDWVPMGGKLGETAGDLTSPSYGPDKGGSYVVGLARARSNNSTLWAATRRGRLFISSNADAADASTVNFTRLDTPAQPKRFISGITVDDKDPNHAFVSFSGYNAYTPTTPGHVFEVRYNPVSGAATWTDLSYNLGDLPATGIARDSQSKALYVSTDFGVITLPAGGNSWSTAGSNLPPVAVYGLTYSEEGKVLYAATHGRGAWRLDLNNGGDNQGNN